MDNKTATDRKEQEKHGNWRLSPADKTKKLAMLVVLAVLTLQTAAGTYHMMERKSVRKTPSPSAEFVIQRPNHRHEHEELRTKHSAAIPISQRPELQHESVMFTPELRPYPDSILAIDETPLTPVVHSIESGLKYHLKFEEKPISQEPDTRSSLCNELLRPQDLDYGRRKGLIFKTPGKKQNIQGFIKIPTVWGSQLQPPDALKRSVIGLAEAVNRYTEIQADIDPHLLLDSRRLHETPFIYITTDQAFELTAIERKNLGDYLRNGGFAVLDNGAPEYEQSQAEASLRRMLRDSLGAHARFLPIPPCHPLYHCFFDFDDGPPQGSEVRLIITQTTYYGCGDTGRNATVASPVYYLEGVWLGDRLVAVYSDKGYAHKWKDFRNNEPQLKMGVNMVVFALIQEGGIAARTSERFTDL